MATPLRVALIHRDSRRAMEQRMVGIWSAPVPEFDWEHFPVEKKFKLNKDDFAGEFDLIFYEDGKLHGQFVGASDIPIAYHVVDSTLSDDHYLIRRDQATRCDLILLCHEPFERFDVGRPVRRLSHCINTKYFTDWHQDRVVDVSFHCRTKGDWERPRMQEWLKNFCRNEQYSYDYGLRKGIDYGKAFNRSRITVNWSRTELNRPHRVLDAMGCRTCLLTRALPHVAGEPKEAGVHFAEFSDYASLGEQIKHLLDSGEWHRIADAGYNLVHREHTWSVRAKQLRKILREELGL